MAVKIKGKQIDIGTLADGQTIEQASGFLQLKNGGIENAKIADATIAQDKLAGSIQDSKLLQIVTADKVAGSALELAQNGGLEDSTAGGADGGLQVKSGGIVSAMVAAGTLQNDRLANSTIAGVALGGNASAMAQAIDGESMALTAVTNVDAAGAGSMTIFANLLAGNGNTLTIGGSGDNAKDAKVVIKGDLQVMGDQVILDTSVLQVEDLSITVAKNAGDSTSADGAGLDIAGAGVNFRWSHNDGRMVLNTSLAATSFVGNASSASQWATARTVAFGGDGSDLSGSFTLNGSADLNSQQLTISADKVTRTHLNPNVVDNASLEQIASGGIQGALAIKSSGVKSNHMDIKQFSVPMGNEGGIITVGGVTDGVRSIILHNRGSSGNQAKYITANASDRQKILLFINGVMLSQSSANNKVGDGDNDDGDFFLQDESGDSNDLEVLINETIFTANDIVTIYGPVGA